MENTTLYTTIANIKGNTFSSLTYMSEVNEIGKGLQAIVGGKVTKITHVTSVKIGDIYENKMRKENPDFVAQPLRWGHWDIFPRIIEHKGSYYLRFYPLESGKATTTYFVNGTEATDEQRIMIEAIIAQKAKNEPFKTRDVKFDNILEICVDHQVIREMREAE